VIHTSILKKFAYIFIQFNTFAIRTVGITNFRLYICGKQIRKLEQTAIDSFYQAVGENLRFHRKKAGFDQETLAARLDLSRTTISNIEKGRQRLSLEHAWLGAQVLNVSIDALLPSTDIKTPQEWAQTLKNSEVNAKDRKSVMEWISKAQFINKK